MKGSWRLAIVTIAVIASCGGTNARNHRQPTPTPIAVAPPPTLAPVVASPTEAPILAAADYRTGEPVQIEFQGTWYPGRVLAVLSDGRYEVGYDGYGPEWNRVTAASSLKPLKAPTSPGAPVQSLAQLASGTPVLIRWGTTWWDGRVRSVNRNGALVSYDGYDRSSDELVTVDRLRLPPQAL